MTVESPNLARRATLWLLGVTLVWGATFLWTRRAMDAAEAVAGRAGLESGSLDLAASCAFVAGRFGLAWILILGAGILWRGGGALGALAARARATADSGTRRSAFRFALLLASGFLLQTFALGELDAAVSAFLTSFYVAMTAVLTSVVERRRPTLFLCLGVVLATVGAGFIDGPPQVTFGLASWLTLLSASIFAVSILATDRYSKRHDGLVLTRVATGWVYLGTFVVTVPVVLGLDDRSLGALGEVVAEWEFLEPLLLCSVFANAGALVLINLFQRHLDPVRAAILYALEPVWTAAWIWLLEGRPPGGWLLFGGTTLLAGNLIAELGPRRRG